MADGSLKIHPSLPIFALQNGDTTALYTPGHVAAVRAEEATALGRFFAGEGAVTGRLEALARTLCARANAAETQWQALSERPFAPECLTVYLSNHCNLGCVYCYAASADGSRNRGWKEGRLPLVDLRAVAAAAQLVAGNCAQKQKPFHLVLHGGGEPTLHWQLLQEVVATVRRVASESGLEVESYLSTSGVLAEEKAQWLAKNISKIGLSVDGSPELQNAQRPLRTGAPTWPSVARTAQVLRQAGAAFCVRTTITQHTVQRQVEILDFLHRHLGAREFTFEPAYRPHSQAAWAFAGTADAARFVDHFLAAQQVAELLGCELHISGVRLDEIHGPYCNVLRNVLQLLPDGTATACFVCTDSAQPQFAGHSLGRWNAATERFEIDAAQAVELRRKAVAIPDRCHSCHNIYHCARDCPDVCPIPRQPDPASAGGFRCEVQRRLGQAWILGSLEEAAANFQLESGEVATLGNYLSQIPAEVSAFALTKQWARARQSYSLQPRRAPDPIWAVRGFDLDGVTAWQELANVAAQQPNSAPLSIYLHIPFCDRKCDFCDCYSLAVKDAQTDQRMHHYTKALRAEIVAWSALPSLPQRPVTTVHFGGGTPAFLPAADLQAIVEELKQRFHTTALTEWALESTTTQLTQESLAQLRDMGFTRLHVGVQTLEEPVRQNVGRVESATMVEEKLRAALRLGMIVTVDVIYGLPGQTVAGFVQTLARLDALGVHGFSLYKLNLTTHNQPFAKRHGIVWEQQWEGFFMFQIGEMLLRAKGYRKTHFAHFSRSADRYLYYTHVRRGEDLLAFGTTADGTFGSLHYRHPELGEYNRILKTGTPTLAGATYETLEESVQQRISADLMTASLPASVMAQAGFQPLLVNWLQHGLLQDEHATGNYILTASGSWLLSEMLEELRTRQPG